MNAVFYPVHLCHERTLELLLAEYDIVHFRDFMALQLTPFMGTTAFPDRMGDYYPELLDAGRIIQGHNVSGALHPDMIAAVDRDLADPAWRSIFHDALSDDYQFQRTLFDESEIRQRRNGGSVEISVLSAFRTPDWQTTPFSVELVKTLSRRVSSSPPRPGVRIRLGISQNERGVGLYDSTVSPTSRYGRDGFGFASSSAHTILLQRTDRTLQLLHQNVKGTKRHVRGLPAGMGRFPRL